jgi:hypothetical protein
MKALYQRAYMTTKQMILWSVGYLVELIVVIYLTRATMLRVLGAIAGAIAAGLFAIGAVVLGESFGWWQVLFASSFHSVPLICFGLVSMTPIYLVTWRVVRRFGWRGLAACVSVVAIIGPPRDYFIAATFPQWMVFGRGVIPILADSAAYVGLIVVGHAVMRLVAGPAGADPFARPRREIAGAS